MLLWTTPRCSTCTFWVQYEKESTASTSRLGSKHRMKYSVFVMSHVRSMGLKSGSGQRCRVVLVRDCHSNSSPFLVFLRLRTSGRSPATRINAHYARLRCHRRCCVGPASLHPSHTAAKPNKDHPVSSNPRGGPPAWYMAGRRSSNRSSVLYMPESATIGSIPAGSGRSAWRDREVWMQSEPRRPQIILSYIGGHVVKSAPQIAIAPCGPSVPACRPQAVSLAPMPGPLAKAPSRGHNPSMHNLQKEPKTCEPYGPGRSVSV